MDSKMAFWNAQAARYDTAVAPLERRFMAAGRRWLAPRARGCVLLVGLGTGADLPYLPAGTQAVGVDLSADMLAAAVPRARSCAAPLPLIVADAALLPFADASFDSVMVTFTLCGVADESRTLVELLRVLRPGGELLLADHVVASSAPVRLVQRGLNAITGGVGEYWTRRPLAALNGLDVDIVASERHTFGVLEWVHARKRNA